MAVPKRCSNVVAVRMRSSAATNAPNGGDEHFFTCDNQYSVTAAVDAATDQVVERYHYTPRGKRIVMDKIFGQQGDGTESAIGVEYAYTGARLDQRTGLQLHRYRYYHPVLGQWLNRDPAGYVDGMSQYRAYFVPSNMDPYGLFVDEEGIRSGRYTYTCNCGWLDSHHYKSFARKFERIYGLVDGKKNGSFDYTTLIQYNFNGNYKYHFNFEENVNYIDEALVILNQIAHKEEQDQLLYAGLTFFGSATRFAFEDISSDAFGGLIGKYMIEGKLSYDDALKKALAGCAPVTEKQSLAVFKANQEVLASGQNKTVKQCAMKSDPCKSNNGFTDWNLLVKLLDNSRQIPPLPPSLTPQIIEGRYQEIVEKLGYDPRHQPWGFGGAK